MASMTDFIESINVADIPSVYNEDYSWAEAYSEYFDDTSDNYIQPILESSSYHFFGEATFYQEAHKGLIAGGMLALVSGAFFMIMKLLKGDGGSSSSSRGSNTKSSSNKPSSKSEPKKSVDKTSKHVEDVHDTVSKKAGDTKKNPNTMPDELKKTGADVGDTKNLSNNTSSKSQKSEKGPKQVEAKQTSKTLPELEDEEKIVFNVEIIIDALKKFKKENGNAGTPYDTNKLKFIYDGLSLVDQIVWDMVGITRDDLWYIVSSSNIKDGKVSSFLENKRKLDEVISKLKSESKDLGSKDIDANPDDLIERLNEINNMIKSIEKNCKTGMQVCKEKRQLEKYKKDVPNIDKVYKRLNDVLRNINVVCKNIQNEFKTIRKSLKGKKSATIEKKKSDNGSSVDAYVDNMPATSFDEFLDSLEIYGVRNISAYLERSPMHQQKFSKSLDEMCLDYDEDKIDKEDFVNNAHSIIEKYAYGADTYLSDSNFRKIEEELDKIGYKSIEAKVGDDISLSKTYWERPIRAKNPGDKESNTIKQIQQMPRVMKINIDGEDVILKLAGKCTYWE